MNKPLPVACTLSPEALTAGRAGLLPGLADRAESIEGTADGCRLRFAPSSETLVAIARVVDAERHCCRFLRFDITVEPDGGPISLTLSGPDGTRAFLSGLMEAVGREL